MTAEREAQRGSEQRGRILVLYATAQHHTEVIAGAIAARLRDHGFVVEIGDVRCGGMPPPEDYDGVVLGLPASFGSDTRLIASYVHRCRLGLAAVPAALFTVSAAGTARDADTSGFLERLLDDLGWHPDLAAAFAGGAPLPREGAFVRFVRHLGHAHDAPPVRGLHTNWTDVRAFADAVANSIATAAVSAERTASHAPHVARP